MLSNVKALTEIDFLGWFIATIVIILIWKGLIELKDWIFTRYGIETKKMKKEREDHEMILANAQAIKDLAEIHKKDNDEANDHDDLIREELHQFITEVRHDIKTFSENRFHDREHCENVQKEWNNKIDNIFNLLDEMQKNTNERFAQSEEKTNKHVQSDIKETIAQAYRRYNISKKISHMELEALEDLIDTYESFGGKNSFVHSVVQKEMYTWEVTG